MQPFQKILVPTDFSPGATAAVERALELGQRSGASLTLLHVYALPNAYAAPYAFSADLFAFIARDAEDQMAKAKASAQAQASASGAGQLVIDAKVVPGYPALRIVEEASAGGYDLIVMGTHGRTGLSHFFIGSVAERVVRTAPCAVLTIRGGTKP